VKTIITLDKANQPYGFPQLNGNGNFDNITATTISATTYYGITNPTSGYVPYNNAGIFADTVIYYDNAKVGVGTPYPSNKLHVYSTSDPLKLEGLQAATDSNLLTVDGSGVVHTYAISNFSGGSVTSVTAGSGLSGNATTGAITLINTKPDKDVVITGGTNIQIVSNYPNFGINFTGTTSSAFTGGTVNGATNFTNGLTANTISATTYSNLPSQSGTGVSAFSYNQSTGLLTITKNDTNTLTAGTFSYVTATTLSAANVLSVASNGTSATTTTINAVTGGTYSNGTITLSGTGSVNGNTITGFPTSLTGAYLPLSGGTMTGGIVANSGVTANTISQTSYIDFTTGSTNPSQAGGRVFFDSTSKALSYYDIANNLVPIAMGQQLYTRVYNATGAQIDKGKVIAITGTSNNLPSAILAVNTHSIISARPIGLAAENIPNGSEGLVLNNGILSGITINGFANGDTLYLSDITPGGYVASSASLSFTARTNEIGYVLQTGSSVGKIYVTINNEDSNLSLTDKERNILEGNVINGGVYEYTGMTQGTGQTINVAYARGWLVKNTYTYATQPDVTNIYYTGGTNIPLTYLTSADATYILINSGATLVQQTTFPTPQQRRENIFLGKVVHPNRSTITSINNTVDFDVSPMAALRDLWTPIKLINQGVVVSYYSAGTMNIQTSAGYLWGNGIGWTTNQLNPDSVYISGTTPTTFQYRSRYGSITGSTSNPGDPAAPTGNTTTIDSHHYDDNGSIVPVGANNRATNQRVYLFPTGLIRIQYGQYSYSTMANAIAGIDTEVFVEFSNNRDNGILIGILTVREDATDLSLTTDAQFRFVSKFGELLAGSGGISTTTLQQAYENSTNPEIVINSTLDGLTIQNGTGNADNVTNLIEGKGTTSGTTSFIRADGLISGSSVSAPTISATTYYGLPKYISATTQSSNVLTSYYSTGGTTTYTPNAATGGTYSNGVITLAGSGALSTITGLGGSGGGGQVYFLNLSNTQTPYKEFSPVATTAAQQTTGTSISSGVTSTLASFLSPVGYPSVNLLPAGIWSFYLHTYKTNVGDSFTSYAQVYKRTSGGTETLLFSTDPATVDGVSPTPRMLLTDVYYSGTSLNLTDRILVVIKGTNNGTSTSTLTLVTEGSLYYSYCTTTFGGGTSNYTTGGTYNASTGILTFTRTDGNTYTAGTFNYVTGSSQSGNLLTLTNNSGGTTTYTPNAVTGGTYSSGTITLAGTGTIGSSISGLISAAATGGTYNSSTGDISLSGTGSLGTISLGTNFVTATTLSAANVLSVAKNGGGPTTTTVNAVTGGSYSNGTITLSGTGTIGSSITGLISTAVTAATLSAANVLSVALNGGSPTTTTVNAVTGGSYSNGTITLSGTGSVNGTQITGLSTGSTGGAGITWNNATSSITASTNNGYVATATTPTLTTITLPSTAAFGSIIEVVGTGTGLWRISQSTASQSIKFGITGTTTGTGGYLSATSQYDCVKLLCTSADTTFVVTSAIGNIFYN
jgi:hypothetical protein